METRKGKTRTSSAIYIESSASRATVLYIVFESTGTECCRLVYQKYMYI